jgi:hypothetical protein
MASTYERRENGDGTYSVNTALTDSDAILPTGVEYRKQKMVPHAAGQVIASNQTGEPTGWIDTNDYNAIAFTMLNDAAVNSTAHVLWSNDGVATHGITVNALATATSKEREILIETRARYAKLRIANNDAAPHTFSSWGYLKV